MQKYQNKLGCGVALTLLMIVFSITAVWAYNTTTTYSVTIDGTTDGQEFRGIGLVNSSGTSKLLEDYPENQQQDILNYLFEPYFGAGLTIVKNEIGADSNSSSGTEPCHQRLSTDTPTARGVNFWIARKAKAVNSDMEFAALRWAIPTWATASYTTKLNYYLNYIDLMIANGTPLDYLSPDKNESTFDATWVTGTLAPALQADDDYSSIKIIGADGYQDWSTISGYVSANSTLAADLSALTNHYVTYSSSTVQNLGLPLYNDESDTPFNEVWSRTMYVAVHNAKQYITGKMTRTMYQPALDSVYDTIKFNGKGILTANTPWSGHYTIHPGLWMTAHWTQFAQPGWYYIDDACGSPDTETDDASDDTDKTDYYVTLQDKDTGDYSVIIVNNGDTDTNYTFTVSNLTKYNDTVHVWATTEDEQFVQQDDITPTDGVYSVTIPAQSVYSLTTTTGQQKGEPTYSIPDDAPMTLPYTDDFSDYSEGDQPKYTYDQCGAWEVTGDGESGNGLQQMVTVQPSVWGTTVTTVPYTLIGDPRWTNYSVSVDVLFDPDNVTSSDYIILGCRNTLNYRDANYQPSGYQMQFFATSGNVWMRKQIFSNSSATNLNSSSYKWATYKSDTTWDNTAWHNLKLVVNGSTITAYVDGTQFVSGLTDTAFTSGQVVLGSSFAGVTFDNLDIEPIDSDTPYACLRVDDADSDITWSGSWSTTGEDGDWKDRDRSRHYSKTSGDYMSYTFTGDAVKVIGRTESDGGKAYVYIDDTLQGTLDSYSSSTYYRASLYSVTGLDYEEHTLKVVLTGTKNSSSSSYYVNIDGIEYNARDIHLDAIDDQLVNVGDTLEFTAEGGDPYGGTLTYSCSDLPDNASIDSSTGVFSWTPTEDQGGSYTLTIAVSNGTETASQTVDITVNNPPVLATISEQTVNEGATLEFTASATDADSDTLTYAATNLPDGASFDTSTGAFSWTPDYTQSGTYTVGITVSDGNATDSQDVTITVNNVNQAPVLDEISDQTVNEGDTLEFTITATDADGDTLTYTATNLPDGASLDSSTGIFSWTPDYTQAGTYTVTFTVSDGTDSDSQAVTITVADVTLSARDATMVSNTIPDTMVAGKTYTATVTVKNTGENTWTEADLYRLGAVGDSDPFALPRQLLSSSDSIASGETKTFSITMTAPSTAGTYTTDWRMVQDKVTWFGDTLTKTVTVLKANNATMVSNTIPETMVAGKTYTVTVTVQNTGNNSWTEASLYRLGAVGDVTTFGSPRHILSDSTVATGDTTTFSFMMTAPSTTGTYTADLQMVQEAVSWFGDELSQTITVVGSNNDAEMVSNTIPDTMIAGQSYTVTVTVQNTGSSSWTESSLYRLGAVGDDTTFGSPRHILSDSSVAYGGSTTFSFVMTAPSTAGTYTANLQMVQEAVSWFGDALSKSITVTTGNGKVVNNSVYDATIVSNTFPTTMTAGSSQTVTVTVENTGDTTWSEADLYRLGAVDDSDSFAGARQTIDSATTVAPGSDYTFSFTLTAPTTAGTYTSDWRMVRDGVCWFGDALSQSITVE